MPIQGHVDAMEGSYVIGWAASMPDTGNCSITITDMDGKILAKGRASRHRADLAALGLGRTTLAYRIAVPLGTEKKQIRVHADGQELVGSPITIGPGHFDGFCQTAKDMILGWVTERAQGSAPPVITVLNQSGREVARGTSKREKGEDPLFAPASFNLQLDDECFGAGEMLLSVYANGQLFGHATCNLALLTNLELITPNRVAGWIYALDAPRRTFELDVYRDGKLEVTAPCDRPRVDVQAQFPECTTPGFDITLEGGAIPADQMVSISVRLAGGQRDLFNGPYLLGSRPAAVSTTLRALRLVNQNLLDADEDARAILTDALRDYLAKTRMQDGQLLDHQPRRDSAAPSQLRLAIIIPVYRGVEVTSTCIKSVLAHRNPETDQIIIINDCSPDAAMAATLAGFKAEPNTLILENPQNLGFVGSVNRGMAIAKGSNMLLLNSDTVMFAGGLDEMVNIAHAHPEIGTVTAMSSNATIFSYPNAELRKPELADISWPELAALALRENAGLFTDVPTGHGFCMFIKDEVVQRIGFLDEAFGRGYGEENDFCARGAALGYRNVAAAGVIVEHKESISFGNERASLIAQNQPRLNALYPEYTPLIMAFEAQDGLRRMRWALDRARLIRARQSGVNFALVISNGLEGGTPKAIRDIEREIGYGKAIRLSLRVTESGLVELSCETPLFCAHFSKDESKDLFEMLDAAAPEIILAHQLLGFPVGVVSGLRDWLPGRKSVYWAHDFYALCPRVTMIDAIGRFCGAADVDTCARCVDMGGAHETSVLTELTPAEHRALFGGLLGRFTHVITPSRNAALYINKVFPEIKCEVIPHPEAAKGVTETLRDGSSDEIVLLGAIGPHKGSNKLLEIAQRARLTHPHLRFRVIGFTNMDRTLKEVGNITITGKYTPDELPELLAQTKGRLALFLPAWPETYSYTLSELVKYGFTPLAPEIGAPADRIREAGIGVIFPFPADAEEVLELIDGIAAGNVQTNVPGAKPAAFFSHPADIERLKQVMVGDKTEPASPQAPKAQKSTDKKKPVPRKASAGAA